MAIVECVPNFSEGRNRAAIDQITRAISETEGATLLDVDPGLATNRTGVTFVGSPEAVVEAAFQAIRVAAQVIDSSDFYRDAHRKIFEVVADLFERGEPADLISVTDRLRALGILDDVGGASYVTSLLHAVPTAANVDYHARLVAQKSVLRQMITAGTQIVSMGFREDQDVEEVVDNAEKLVFGIANRRIL